MDLTVSDMMNAYAMNAVDHAKAQGINLDFSPESVRAVESILDTMYSAKPKGFLARLFSKALSQDVIRTFANIYGGYMGEVLRRTSGGEWYVDQEIVPSQQTIGLRKGTQRIWPLAKVGKRLSSGPEDNVWHYFQIVLKDWPSIA